MNTTVLKIISVMAASSGSISLGSIAAADVTTTNVMADLNSCSGFVASNYPKNLAYEHATGTRGDFQSLTMADGQESFKSIYLYLYHPSAKSLMYWNTSTASYTQAGGYKIKLSTSVDYNTVTRWDAELSSVSDDGLFAKFRIHSEAGFGNFTGYEQTRGYEFESFEVMDADKANSNSYALGDRFTVSGKGSLETLSHDLIDVVNLSAKCFDYQFSVTNSHSQDANDNGGFLPSGSDWLDNMKVYTKVFSVGFHLSKDYGDCVGVKLHWQMEKYCSPSTDTSWQALPASIETHDLDFTDQSLLKVPDNPDVLRKALVNMNLKAYTYPGWATNDVPCIQKVDAAIAGSTAKNSSGVKDCGQYLANDAGCDYYAKEVASYPLDNYYALHFDYRDTVFTSPSVPWWMWLSPFTAIGSAVYLGTHSGNVATWASSDVAIISLVMRKDGKNYVLKTSSDAGSTEPSASDPDHSVSSWQFWLIVVAVIAGCVLIAWLVIELIKAIGSLTATKNKD